MGNRANTISEQIDKLKSRGLIIDDEKKAQEQLLDIGYYRLGFYAYHFQDKNHNFKENIKFSDLIDLYYFDTDLKMILLKYITRIEVNFRTKIVYFVSNEYPDIPVWFAHSKVLNRSFVDELPNFYNDKFKKNNKTIKKHHLKYPNDIYAPAWKTVEFFTFGSVITIYKSLKSQSLKQKIAKEYGLKSFNTLINFLETILFVRNVSAHGGTFYDANTRHKIKKTSLIPFPEKDKHAPSTAISVVLFILNKVSENRALDMQNEIKDILNQYSNNQNVSEIIQKCMRNNLHLPK